MNAENKWSDQPASRITNLSACGVLAKTLCDQDVALIVVAIDIGNQDNKSGSNPAEPRELKGKTKSRTLNGLKSKNRRKEMEIDDKTKWALDRIKLRSEFSIEVSSPFKYCPICGKEIVR